MRFASYSLPVYVCEEGMFFQLFGISLREANSLCGVSLQKHLQKTYGLVTEVGLHGDWLLNYISEHLLTVSIIVGWSSA